MFFQNTQWEKAPIILDCWRSLHNFLWYLKETGSSFSSLRNVRSRFCSLFLQADCRISVQLFIPGQVLNTSLTLSAVTGMLPPQTTPKDAAAGATVAATLLQLPQPCSCCSSLLMAHFLLKGQHLLHLLPIWAASLHPKGTTWSGRCF